MLVFSPCLLISLVFGNVIIKFSIPDIKAEIEIGTFTNKTTNKLSNNEDRNAYTQAITEIVKDGVCRSPRTFSSKILFAYKSPTEFYDPLEGLLKEVQKKLLDESKEKLGGDGLALNATKKRAVGFNGSKKAPHLISLNSLKIEIGKDILETSYACDDTSETLGLDKRKNLKILLDQFKPKDRMGGDASLLPKQEFATLYYPSKELVFLQKALEIAKDYNATTVQALNNLSKKPAGGKSMPASSGGSGIGAMVAQMAASKSSTGKMNGPKSLSYDELAKVIESESDWITSKPIEFEPQDLKLLSPLICSRLIAIQETSKEFPQEVEFNGEKQLVWKVEESESKLFTAEKLLIPAKRPAGDFTDFKLLSSKIQTGAHFVTTSFTLRYDNDEEPLIEEKFICDGMNNIPHDLYPEAIKSMGPFEGLILKANDKFHVAISEQNSKSIKFINLGSYQGKADMNIGLKRFLTSKPLTGFLETDYICPAKEETLQPGQSSSGSSPSSPPPRSTPGSLNRPTKPNTPKKYEIAANYEGNKVYSGPLVKFIKDVDKDLANKDLANKDPIKMDQRSDKSKPSQIVPASNILPRVALNASPSNQSSIFVEFHRKDDFTLKPYVKQKLPLPTPSSLTCPVPYPPPHLDPSTNPDLFEEENMVPSFSLIIDVPHDRQEVERRRIEIAQFNLGVPDKIVVLKELRQRLYDIVTTSPFLKYGGITTYLDKDNPKLTFPAKPKGPSYNNSKDANQLAGIDSDKNLMADIYNAFEGYKLAKVGNKDAKVEFKNLYKDKANMDKKFVLDFTTLKIVASGKEYDICKACNWKEILGCSNDKSINECQREQEDDPIPIPGSMNTEQVVTLSFKDSDYIIQEQKFTKQFPTIDEVSIFRHTCCIIQNSENVHKWKAHGYKAKLDDTFYSGRINELIKEITGTYAKGFKAEEPMTETERDFDVRTLQLKYTGGKAVLWNCNEEPTRIERYKDRADKKTRKCKEIDVNNADHGDNEEDLMQGTANQPDSTKGAISFNLILQVIFDGVLFKVGINTLEGLDNEDFKNMLKKVILDTIKTSAYVDQTGKTSFVVDELPYSRVVGKLEYLIMEINAKIADIINPDDNQAKIFTVIEDQSNESAPFKIETTKKHLNNQSTVEIKQLLYKEGSKPEEKIPIKFDPKDDHEEIDDSQAKYFEALKVHSIESLSTISINFSGETLPDPHFDIKPIKLKLIYKCTINEEEKPQILEQFINNTCETIKKSKHVEEGDVVAFNPDISSGFTYKGGPFEGFSEEFKLFLNDACEPESQPGERQAIEFEGLPNSSDIKEIYQKLHKTIKTSIDIDDASLQQAVPTPTPTQKPSLDPFKPPKYNSEQSMPIKVSLKKAAKLPFEIQSPIMKAVFHVASVVVDYRMGKFEEKGKKFTCSHDAHHHRGIGTSLPSYNRQKVIDSFLIDSRYSIEKAHQVILLNLNLFNQLTDKANLFKTARNKFQDTLRHLHQEIEKSLSGRISQTLTEIQDKSKILSNLKKSLKHELDQLGKKMSLFMAQSEALQQATGTTIPNTSAAQLDGIDLMETKKLKKLKLTISKHLNTEADMDDTDAQIKAIEEDYKKLIQYEAILNGYQVY